MLEHRTLERFQDERYAGWRETLGEEILSGRVSLAELEARVSKGGIDPRPRSGRQELLENLVNQRVWAAGDAGGKTEGAGDGRGSLADGQPEAEASRRSRIPR
jgi:hypothetical protein